MSITISSKYQLVIPKEARKKLRVRPGALMTVKKVTPTEITYTIAPGQTGSIEDYAGILKSAWGNRPVAKLRKIRDEQWD